MTRSLISVAFLAALLLSPALLSAGKEVKVKFKDCPKAVQDTLTKAASPDGVIKEIEKETRKDGRVVYEAEVKIADKLWEIAIAYDGTLLSKELEDDDEDEDDDDDDDEDDDDDDDEDEDDDD